MTLWNNGGPHPIFTCGAWSSISREQLAGHVEPSDLVCVFLCPKLWWRTSWDQSLRQQAGTEKLSGGSWNQAWQDSSPFPFGNLTFKVSIVQQHSEGSLRKKKRGLWGRVGRRMGGAQIAIFAGPPPDSLSLEDSCILAVMSYPALLVASGRNPLDM